MMAPRLLPVLTRSSGRAAGLPSGTGREELSKMRMRRSIAVLALAVVTTHAAGSASQAQVVRGVFGPRAFVGPGGPVMLTPGYGYPATVAAPSPAYAPGYAPPYSYYVLPSSVPSRIYIGPDVYP